MADGGGKAAKQQEGTTEKKFPNFERLSQQKHFVQQHLVEYLLLRDDVACENETGAFAEVLIGALVRHSLDQKPEEPKLVPMQVTSQSSVDHLKLSANMRLLTLYFVVARPQVQFLEKAVVLLKDWKDLVGSTSAMQTVARQVIIQSIREIASGKTGDVSKAGRELSKLRPVLLRKDVNELQLTLRALSRKVDLKQRQAIAKRFISRQPPVSEALHGVKKWVEGVRRAQLASCRKSLLQSVEQQVRDDGKKRKSAVDNGEEGVEGGRGIETTTSVKRARTKKKQGSSAINITLNKSTVIAVDENTFVSPEDVSSLQSAADGK